MKTKEKGITLIALAVTILVCLILAGLSVVSILSDKGIIKQSQNAKEIHIEKKYNEGIQLAKTKAEIDYHDKNVDKGYFEEIKIYLNSMNDFKEKATYKFVKYDKESNIEDENVEDNQVNALIVNIKKYKFIVEKNATTTIIENKPHQHEYKYYDSNGIDLGSEHPTNIGKYKYKCKKCGDVIQHEITSEYIEKDEKEHYIYICSCGIEATENHFGGTEATCTEEQKCEKCNRTLIAALNHDFTSKTISDVYKKSDATCTKASEYYYKCSRCDESSKDNTNTTYTDGNALGHSYKYYNSSGTATGTSHPTSAGTYTYKCSNNCGIGTTTHTVSTNQKNNASTHYTYRCSCGNCQSTANHTFGSKYKGSTGDSNYYTYHYYKCSACNYVKSESHNNNSGYSYAYTGSGHIKYKTCNCGVKWDGTSQSCSYTNRYSRTNDTNHMAYCACGHGTSQKHSYPGQYTSAKCSKCGDMYGISGA